MAHGGASHVWLERLRQFHPFSLRGVGISLDGAEELLDGEHLTCLRALVYRYEPGLVKHLAWCRCGGRFFND